MHSFANSSFLQPSGSFGAEKHTMKGVQLLMDELELPQERARLFEEPPCFPVLVKDVIVSQIRKFVRCSRGLP